MRVLAHLNILAEGGIFFLDGLRGLDVFGCLKLTCVLG